MPLTVVSAGLQHGDREKTIADFRLTTRTFYVNNPIVQFWYWHSEHLLPPPISSHLGGVHAAVSPARGAVCQRRLIGLCALLCLPSPIPPLTPFFSGGVVVNYHTEHHMYATVPCYHLAGLHAAIKHDLPPTPDGILAVWRVIADVLAEQKHDPLYCQPIALPNSNKVA